MKLSDVSAQLSAPFPADAIHWRVGATNGDKTKGIALAYIDARDVFDRFDSVVGPENWETRIEETAKGRVLCALTVLGTTKTDGAGDTDMEGDKGGISDAIKRAAVQFGVGRYLYRLPNVWVPIKPAGKSYRLAETPSLPSWALPEGEAKKPAAKKKPEPVEDNSKFIASVNKVIQRGIEVLQGIGHEAEDAADDMQDRIDTILKTMGGYVSVSSITLRDEQVAFYNSLKETVERMGEEAA